MALRYFLLQHGLKTDTQGGGDVHIKPQTNSITVQEFKSGQIDGGWLPEPYASELVAAGGTKLVDERSLWPSGQFATTLLVVRTAFPQQHPDVVAKLLKGQVDATDYINKQPAAAQAAANAELTALTGKGLKPNVVSSAFKEITFTDDPVASSLTRRRAARGEGRAAPAGQPQRDLRSRPAQQRAGRGRRADGVVMSLAGPRTLAAAHADARTSAAATAPDGSAVRLSDVSKVYGRGSHALLALDRISLTVAPGEFVCLLGASGCGKSTLLSLVTGLDEASAGTVEVPGRTTLMFQEAALFPWLTAGAQRRARPAGELDAGQAAARAGATNCSPPCTWPGSAASGRMSCPAGCASGWRSPARSPRTWTCSRWTSRSARSTR